jgi:hypothetical protein
VPSFVEYIKLALEQLTDGKKAEFVKAECSLRIIADSPKLIGSQELKTIS